MKDCRKCGSKESRRAKDHRYNVLNIDRCINCGHFEVTVRPISRLIRRLLPVLGSILIVLIAACPVVAAEPQPDSMVIREIVAYQNANESGDQLYIVTYEITGNYTQNADQMFIFRIREGTTELDHTTPFPFYNQGYGSGIVAFYFEPAEVPTWEGDISVEIIGNPLIDWEGTIPSTALDYITWNTGTIDETHDLIGATILYLATILGQEWGIELVTTIQGITSLTSAGASYFQVVIPFALDMVPAVFGSYTFTPDFPIDPKPPSNSYADDLLDGVAGTVFDVRPAAREWGMSSGALSAFIWYAFFIGLFILLMQRQRLNRGTILVFWPIVVAGMHFGVPLTVTIIAAFFCLISTVWVFYKGVT